MESECVCVSYYVEANVGMKTNFYLLERDAVVINVRATGPERHSVLSNSYERCMADFLGLPAERRKYTLLRMISELECFRDAAVFRFWVDHVAGVVESMFPNYLYLLETPQGFSRSGRRGFRFDIEFNLYRGAISLEDYRNDVRNRSSSRRRTSSARGSGMRIAGLKRLKYPDDSNGGRFEEKECAICLEEYKKNGGYLGRISCLHSFHYRCLKKWLEKKPSCPLCRREI